MTLAALAIPAQAQSIGAVASGAWDAPSTWSDNAAPTAGNDYTVGSGFQVNAPSITSAGSFTRLFGGNSLTVLAGGTLQLLSSSAGGNATASYTIPGLTLSSGSTLLLTANLGNIDRTLQTGLSLAGSGSVTIANNHVAGGFNNTLTLGPSAILSGAADINLNFDSTGQAGLMRRLFRVSSANNPYSGNWNVSSVNITPGTSLGGLYANAINALGTGHVTLNSSLLVNQVGGGLNSLNGVSVGSNSLVQVNAAWTNPAATLALNASTAAVTLNGIGTAMNIGNLSGVSGASITGNAADESLGVNITGDSLYAGTITGSLAVVKDGAATLTLTGANTYTGGTTINAGTLQLGDGGTSGSVTGNVTDNGVLAFNRSDVFTYANTVSGTGSVTQTGTGTTTLASDNTYTGGTTISAGTLQLGNGGTSGSIVGNVADNGSLVFDRSDDVSFSGVVSGTGSLTQAGTGTTSLTAINTYSGPTIVRAGTLAVDGSIQSATTVMPGGTLAGFGTIIGDVVNQGVVWPGNAVAGDTQYGALTIRGNYSDPQGQLALNTLLGTDGSPSSKLVIDGGTASGTTTVVVHPTAVTGTPTQADGILVVQALNGATTGPQAFVLPSEVRGGALDYRLFRGGIYGASPEDWFLRNDFLVPAPPPEEPPVAGPVQPLPADPPPSPLPPGSYPIIGPEIATYGVVQPLARQFALATLGTLHDRVGDTPLMDTVTPTGNFSPPLWGRVFGGSFDNHYQAFADPRADGHMSGFQAGGDLWRGSLMPGHTENAGAYLAYSDANVDVTGNVTNAAATSYVLQHTGTVDLQAWSVGAYWTHYGPGGWYTDTVVQGTRYTGNATTNFTQLDTTGWGFIGSLEAGYPLPLPLLGPGFVLEPQAQILWQHVSFDDGNDGQGEVALGSTSGVSGRLGLRGKWHFEAATGLVCEPYLTADLWQDWGGRATTLYSSTDAVPLSDGGSRLSLGGGLSAMLSNRLRLYLSAAYQFALSNADGGEREGISGSIGMRYTW